MNLVQKIGWEGEMKETATDSQWSLKAFFRGGKYGWRKAFLASFKASRVPGGKSFATWDRLFAQSCPPFSTLEQPSGGEILAITSI